MKIIDNFLEEEEFNHVKNAMLSTEFPWYLSGILYGIDDVNGTELAHRFYDNHTINSAYWWSITPLINKIKPRSVVRVRALLMPKNERNLDLGWHTDFDFDCTTAIFYVNDNDGYTLFEDGTKVESVANRFVSFDSHNRHTGVHPTNTQFRCLINFNYF